MEKNYPQKAGLQQLLKSAFIYWNRTLFYQLSYSLIYFSLFFLGYFYLFRYMGLWDEVRQYSDLAQTDFPAFNKKMEEIALMPQTQRFVLGIFVLFGLLNPLNVGLYSIYRKMDLKESISLNDLFAGYIGFNFFKFFGFYLFWIIIFSYANSLVVLGFVWIILTLFSVPLMFFMNVKTFEGIKLTCYALKDNFTIIIA